MWSGSRLYLSGLHSRMLFKEKVGWGRGRSGEEKNFEADILTRENIPSQKKL